MRLVPHSPVRVAAETGRRALRNLGDRSPMTTMTTDSKKPHPPRPDRLEPGTSSCGLQVTLSLTRSSPGQNPGRVGLQSAPPGGQQRATPESRHPAPHIADPPQQVVVSKSLPTTHGQQWRLDCKRRVYSANTVCVGCVCVGGAPRVPSLGDTGRPCHWTPGYT